MNSLMSLQRVQPDKFITARPTGVGRLLSVGPPVAAEMGNGRELSSAVGALVRLDAGMSSTVDGQVRAGREAFAAVVAGEGPLSAMCP